MFPSFTAACISVVSFTLLNRLRKCRNKMRFASTTKNIEMHRFHGQAITQETFWLLMRDFRIPNYYGNAPPKDERLFRSLFGCHPQLCVDIWKLCAWKQGTTPKHLLWALLFLKTYGTEDVICSLAGCSRKTFRRWLWPTVKSIADSKRKVVSATSVSTLLSSRRCTLSSKCSPRCILLVID